jgi:hypothetical protein
VRGEQDRDLAALAQASDRLEQLVADTRVEADRGLVEEQHLRLGDERAGDLEPATLATAVARDGPVEELGEAERLGELADAALAAPGLTRQRRAWMSRLRRPVRARSTTGSWKTTL